MIALAWCASLLLFIPAGLVLWRFADIAALDLPARISIAFTSGLVIVTSVMYVESALGISWSVVSLGLPLLALFAFSARRNATGAGAPWPRSWKLTFAVVVMILIYAAATARMTIGDLMYFWGPKAVHFFHARTIDIEFLKFPHYYLMHPDYPPLVPLAWSASAMIAGRFSYWGAVWTTPILLVCAALTFRGFAVSRLGPRKSSAFATLLLGVLTTATIAGSAAGGGDPYLLAFEATALSALTFSRSRGAVAVSALALAGGAFTKVEGAAFVAAVAIALVLVGRFREVVAVAGPAVVLVVSWIVFVRHHGLLDAYGRADRQLHFENVRLVLLRTAQRVDYHSLYAPWVASLGPFLAARSVRAAALPLLVALASIAYALFFYLHEPDPLWWIQSSAERVMTTPLLCFVVATAAASE